MRGYLVLLLILSCNVEAANAAQDTNFDATLKKIIQAASSDFRSLRGAPDPDLKDVWVANVSLPGTDNCEVYGEQGSPSFTCDIQRSDAESDLEGPYDSFVAKTRKSLSGWSSKSTSRSKIVKGIEFEKGAVTVRIRIRQTPHGYLLDIWIDQDDE